MKYVHCIGPLEYPTISKHYRTPFTVQTIERSVLESIKDVRKIPDKSFSVAGEGGHPK